MIEITSAENQVIKHIRKLSAHLWRQKYGETVLEGERIVNDAAAYGGELDTVLIREGYKGRIPEAKRLYKAPEKLFDSLTETVTPQGILASVKYNMTEACDVFKGGLVIFCDRVQDPGNLGTIFRTAHAVGADGVILMKGCADPYAPKTVRSSMGSVFALPVAETDVFYKPEGYTAVCGTLSEKAKGLHSVSFPEKTMLILGNEANGASEEVITKSEEHVLIPMPGGAESLNVAAAGAVMMYEYHRQVQYVR